MKSQELQALVKEIFSNEKTKTEFTSNPNGVLARYNLTEQEKRAVLSAHAKIGLVTSDSGQLEAALNPTMTWFAPAP
jgi:hypothetical protein